MAEEYRFLRFEVSGIVTISYAIALALPFIGDKLIENLFAQSSFFLAFVGGTFILSLPLGYAIHQMVVNSHRSGKKEGLRSGVKYAEELITRDPRIKQVWDKEKDVDKKVAFVTAVMEIGLVKTHEVNSTGLFDRREIRWSHYYARRAVGAYSPTFGIMLFAIFIVASIQVGDYFTYSWLRLLVFVMILIIILLFSFFVIWRYSGKLWEEICYLELVNVKLSKSSIEEIAKSLADDILRIKKLPDNVRTKLPPSNAWIKKLRRS